MAQGTLPPNPNSSDPYEQLGITADATFEQVQAAKQNCLNQIKADDAGTAAAPALHSAAPMAGSWQLALTGAAGAEECGKAAAASSAGRPGPGASRTALHIAAAAHAARAGS